MMDDDVAPPPPARRYSSSRSQSVAPRPGRRDSDSDDDGKSKPKRSGADSPRIGSIPGEAAETKAAASGSASASNASATSAKPNASDAGVWVEFKGPDGKQLWFNTTTKEIKYDGSIGIVKPKPGTGTGANSARGSDDDTDDEPVSRSERDRRRRSTRRKDSDDDDDSGNDSSEEGKKRRAEKKAQKAAAAAAATASTSPAGPTVVTGGTPQASPLTSAASPTASAAPMSPIAAPGSNQGVRAAGAGSALDEKKKPLDGAGEPERKSKGKRSSTKTSRGGDGTDAKGDDRDGFDGKDEKDTAPDMDDGDDEDDNDAKRLDNGVMSIDKIVRSLTVIERHVTVILDKSQNLTPAVCEDLRTILSRVSNVQSSLASKAGIDDRNEVDGLIDYPRVPWNFGTETAPNDFVKSYRATAVRWNHSAHRYTAWEFPEYFSACALPSDIPKEVTANIRLPVPEGLPPKSIGVKITAKDTALDVMKRARDLAIELDIDNHVFKAFGLREFMDGNQLIFSYEYVRQNLRDGKKLELVLCKRPDRIPLPPSLQNTDLEKWYHDKVSPNDTPFLQPNDMKDLANPFATPFDALKHIPLNTVHQPFRIKVAGLDNATLDTLPRLEQDGIIFTHVYVEVFVFHGMEKLEGLTFNTSKCEVTAGPRWAEWLAEPLAANKTLLSSIPRETRIGFVVQGVTNDKGKTLPLAWCVRNLIDEHGVLSHGKVDLKLWPFPGKKKKGGHGKVRDLSQNPSFFFRATTRDNDSTENPKGAALLRVEFPSYPLPVVAPLCDEYREPNPRVVGAEFSLKALNKKQTKGLEQVIEADALYVMTPEDKELVWKIRHHLVKYPLLLPKFLQSVKWHIPDCRHEAHRLLDLWTPPMSHLLALELLDAKYPDYRVREYAVTVLRRLPDDELRLYLLQITQCLKYEQYHESPLTRFLMERALKAPYEIGHHFFWHLKAELHSPMFAERFALILEEFLSHSPREAYELRKQNSAVLKLERIASMIVTLKRDNGASDAEAMKEYTREIEKLNRDFFLPNGKFQIPFNPKLEATSLIVEKCRYMSSKMVPLWLVFRNADADAPPIYIIFKSGDDLRQDILTLQLLRVMDQTWLQNGQDMRMKPYACIATGVNDNHEGVGMIEVVMNSDTTSGIQLKYGGGAVGALKLDPIERFISDHNKAGKEYDHAVDNFVRSCAGYCVATYVLGIGDRHNGNIMVTKGGHLFHIDFGHFLGNFKKKFGVNRERAAFVFTPEMAYVMGGKNYKKSNLFKQFLKLCSEAFKYLRQNSIVLENMFILMVSAGMPELLLEKDIHYLRDKLAIGLPEKKADETLHAEIDKSLDSTYRRIDNMIHNLKHG